MILVIGATGTVGRQVVAQAVQAGAEVRAMVRDPGKATFPPGVEVARGDLSDPASLQAPLLGADAVFLMWPFLDADGAVEVLDVIKRHAVRVVYLPESFVVGRTLSLASLVGLTVALGIRRRLRVSSK